MYVDGTLKAQVDTYSASDQAQAVNYAIAGLSPSTHTITIEVLGILSEATVYFAADEFFTRSVLGKTGWLDRVKLGLVDYEAKLLLSPYR